MWIRGNWYSGDSHKYCLTQEKVLSKRMINKIKNVIFSLKNLYCEFVVIDLYADSTNIIDKPTFFQLYKDRTFGMTEFYVVEVGIKRKNFVEIYSKSRLGYEEVIYHLNEICLKRKYPDLGEWKRMEKVFGEDAEELNDKEIIKLKKIAISYWYKKVSEVTCIEALEKLMELQLDYQYMEYLIVAYPNDRVGNIKRKQIFEKLSCHPIVALEMGKIEYYGKLGAPNFKKAFEYFSHASKIGSISANHYLGQMYKYGQYVKKDLNKYEELTRSVYDFLVDAQAEHCFPGIDATIMELAEIEFQKGNEEKSLEYCLLARKSAIKCSIHGCSVSDTLCKATIFLYKLIEYDQNNTDLFDIFYLLANPNKIRIRVLEENIIVQSIEYNGELVVKYRDEIYRNVKVFLENCRINGRQLSTYYSEIFDIEVLSGKEYIIC